MVEEELVADPVQLVGADAGRHVPADLGKGPRGDPPRYPHALDRVRVLDVGLAEARPAAADVLGAVDVCGNVARRGNPAGLEGSSHDL